MINSSKVILIAALLLVGFAIIPGWLEEFDIAPESARVTALAACVLFLAGLLLGCRLAASPRPWTVEERRADRSGRGLYLLGLALLACTAYVLIFGPRPPIFAAASGFDAVDSALMREDALKLNTDTLFVKLYSYTRDILSPIVFVLTIEALFRRGGQGSTRALWIAFLAAAIFIALWSGQKATIVNYLLAAGIFVARDARQLLRWLLIGAPVIAVLTFAMFAVTYPGIFSGMDSTQALSNVMEGLVHRIYTGPFEVSVAYVDAIDNQGLIGPRDAVPYLGPLFRPGQTLENLIGVEYFYSSIDSISANAFCYAYAYVVGGLPSCFLSGILTIVVLDRSVHLARRGGSIFIARAFQAMISYRLLDLLNSNFYSHLISVVQLAFVAWVLARADFGRTSRRARVASVPNTV